MCDYFALCANEPEGFVQNPIVGPVLTCARCAARMEQELVLPIFDPKLSGEFAADSGLAHNTCTTCLTSITEVDGIWYHDHGDSHGLAQHLARPSKR